MRVSDSAFQNFSKQVFAGAMVFALVIAGVATVTGGSAEAARVKAQGHTPSTGYGKPEGPKPVNRSYNRVTGDHFYTIAPNEHASANSKGGYNHEHGQAFHAYDKAHKGTQPVYRSLNPQNNDHFYTASFGEYAKTIKAGWHLEGVAFYAYTNLNQVAAGEEVEEILRSVHRGNGEHLYTANDNEHKDAVVKSKAYKEEGIAFFAPVVD